jgi:hypothetical protein
MYAPLAFLFLTIGVVLLLATVYMGRAEVFSSAVAGLLFALVSVDPQLETVSNGELVTVTVTTPVRYVLFALALLSWVLTVTHALGLAPEQTPEATRNV